MFAKKSPAPEMISVQVNNNLNTDITVKGVGDEKYNKSVSITKYATGVVSISKDQTMQSMLEVYIGNKLSSKIPISGEKPLVVIEPQTNVFDLSKPSAPSPEPIAYAPRPNINATPVPSTKM